MNLHQTARSFPNLTPLFVNSLSLFFLSNADQYLFDSSPVSGVSSILLTSLYRNRFLLNSIKYFSTLVPLINLFFNSIPSLQLKGCFIFPFYIAITTSTYPNFFNGISVTGLATTQSPRLIHDSTVSNDIFTATLFFYLSSCMSIFSFPGMLF